MNYSMHLLLTLATLPAPRGDDDPASPETLPPLADVLAPTLQRLQELRDAFRAQPVSPARARHFERQLQDTWPEGGRLLVQHTCNHLEPAHVEVLPKHVHWQATAFTRLYAKTPQNAWTLFGPIRLWRVGYRPTDKGGDPTLFPLPRALGLVHGASAALAERAAVVRGETGMTQLGSGVTEAGCKRVYTQRLKLSGMRWHKAGAQTILNLRVVLLSGVWEAAYARVLEGSEEVRVGGQRVFHEIEAENAA
jgi:hypothetical protein